MQGSSVELTFSKRAIVNDPETGRDANVDQVVFVLDGNLQSVAPYVVIGGVQVGDRTFTHTFKTWARRDIDYSLIASRQMYDPINDDQMITLTYQIDDIQYDEGQNAFMTISLTEIKKGT